VGGQIILLLTPTPCHFSSSLFPSHYSLSLLTPHYPPPPSHYYHFLLSIYFLKPRNFLTSFGTFSMASRSLNLVVATIKYCVFQLGQPDWCCMETGLILYPFLVIWNVSWTLAQSSNFSHIRLILPWLLAIHHLLLSFKQSYKQIIITYLIFSLFAYNHWLIAPPLYTPSLFTVHGFASHFIPRFSLTSHSSLLHFSLPNHYQ
jgi:hypothetical protein